MRHTPSTSVVALLCALCSVATADLRQPLTDADIRRLEAEWDKDDDLEDDMYEQKRKSMERGNAGGFDPNMFKNLKPGQDPQEMMMASSAKGQTKMMFVKPNPGTTSKEMEKLAGLWQGALLNAHIDVKPYMIEKDRFMYTVDDGSLVPQITDFLKNQKEFDYMEVDSRKIYGKFSASKANPTLEQKEKEALEKQTAKKKKRAEYDRDHGLKHKLPPKPGEKQKSSKENKPEEEKQKKAQKKNKDKSKSKSKNKNKDKGKGKDKDKDKGRNKNKNKNRKTETPKTEL